MPKQREKLLVDIRKAGLAALSFVQDKSLGDYSRERASTAPDPVLGDAAEGERRIRRRNGRRARSLPAVA